MFSMGVPDLFSVIWIIIVITIIIGLFVLLVFKAEKIVGLLKLDKGFDDDRIELGNLTSASVIKIGSFVVGGLMILHNIPAFLGHALWAFKGEIRGIPYDRKDYFNWMVSGLNVLIGFLLVTNYGFVAKLLRSKGEDN
jgi:hypothetical protein